MTMNAVTPSVLLINDECGKFNGLQDALASRGVITLWAESVSAGLEQLHLNSVDVVVIDDSALRRDGRFCTVMAQLYPSTEYLVLARDGGLGAVADQAEGRCQFCLGWDDKRILLAIEDAIQRIYFERDSHWLHSLSNERHRALTSIQEDQKGTFLALRETLNILISAFTDPHYLDSERIKIESAKFAKRRHLANLNADLRTLTVRLIERVMAASIPAERREYAQPLGYNREASLLNIDHLLNFSLIDTDNLSLQEDWFDPVRVVEAAKEVMPGLVGGCSISFISVYSPSLKKHYWGDQSTFCLVVLILLKNAVQYTQSGGVIVRLLPDTTTGFVLQVEDSGKGISREDQEAIFTALVEPEGKVNADPCRSPTGLLIVGRLLGLMGGSIRVSSKLGRGSKFSILLPLADDRQIRPEDVNSVVEKLYLLTDNSMLARGIAEQIEYWGCHCEVFNRHQTKLLNLDCAMTKVVFVDAEFFAPNTAGAVPKFTLPDGVNKFMLLGVEGLPEPMLDSDCPLAMSVILKPIRYSALKDALTMADTRSSHVGTRLAKSSTSTPSRPRILLAEDDGANRVLVSALLQDKPYALSFADDGIKAVEKIRSASYDLILIDLALPSLGGLRVAQAIRDSVGPNQYTTIVALTEDTLAEDRERCIRAGINGFLSKPINIDRFLNYLKYWQRRWSDAGLSPL